MYEQAKIMGKGDEMKRVLFRTIHKDKITGVLDRSIREMLIKEVGLDVKAFEKDGEWEAGQAFDEGRLWANGSMFNIPHVVIGREYQDRGR